MIVAGKYRLTRLLGRGGMGSVWEGVHETLGTRVAVKLIEAEHIQSGDSRRRFETEARAAAKLQSKHVVEVYDYGVTAEGCPFIVMQYLAGEALDQRLDRVGRLPPEETARIVVQICRALSRAHAGGIVHRDLKPENVFLVQDEEDGTELVKVVDFGIAKVVGDSPEDSSTRTGSVLGTPFYMSPEQARGLKSVDQRSDLWSVAVIAFRCMVGRLPFLGEAVGDVLVNLCTGPIPIPSELSPDLPPGFDAWMERGLSRVPDERFQSAAELGETLAAVCGLGLRVGPSTGDVPVQELEPLASRALTPAPKQVITAPTYPAGDRLSGMMETLASPTPMTGAATTRTPAPQGPPARSSPLVGVLLVALAVAIGVAVVLSVRSPAAPEPAKAGVPAVAPPAPITATKGPEATPTATTIPPAAAPSDSPAAGVAPSAAAPAPSAEAAAAPKPGAPAPRKTTSGARVAAPARHPASTSTSTPNLEIRLQR